MMNDLLQRARERIAAWLEQLAQKIKGGGGGGPQEPL
jgi:hypothetical protein